MLKYQCSLNDRLKVAMIPFVNVHFIALRTRRAELNVSVIPNIILANTREVNRHIYTSCNKYTSNILPVEGGDSRLIYSTPPPRVSSLNRHNSCTQTPLRFLTKNRYQIFALSSLTFMGFLWYTGNPSKIFTARKRIR